MKTSTWFEFAALPLIAGFALGSGFILGGDDSRRMIETFSPKELTKTVPTPEPLNKKDLGSHPGRNVASRMQPWGLLTTDAQEAWRLSEGSRKILVAVIDTGADVDHPDLKDNIWINPGESGRDDLGRDKATNGIDDDGNGYVDDIHGWNFVFDNENVQDHHGHGTHIAGIIGATGSSKLTGVAPHVSLMILKYFDPRKSATQNPLEATIKAIHYAIKNGAQVINYSGGGLAPSAQEYAALQEAAAKGILVVAAAGNEHTNSDHNRYYPADYDLPNILSVTAMNPNAKVLTTSNFGPETVDIAAPGEDIFSTLPDGGYGTMTGTSQATAFATGVAVLVKSMHPEMTPEQIIEHLVATGEPTKSLTGKTRARSSLNAYRALAIAGTDESVSGVTHSADDARFILNAR